MAEWKEQRILILGCTYPTYSKKYVENVCTGAIVDGSFDLARVHPIPKRYLEDAQQFRSFQWITGQVAPHGADGRPESLKIQPGSIVLGDWIPPKDAVQRVAILRKSRHMCPSVEELRDRWERDRVSMGIVQPKEILGVRLVNRPDSERLEWLAKEHELLSQQNLFTPPKPLDWPEVAFMVAWKCDDPRCTGHDMGLKTWGLHELYRKLRGDCDPNVEEKVLDKMRADLDLAKRDVYFFLGSFNDRKWQFGLMDTYSAVRDRLPDPRQGGLFG